MKKDNKKLKTAASTPEKKNDFDITIFPKENYISYKGEEKSRYIVPDDIFVEHLKELPVGTINESRTLISSFGGSLLKPLGSDPENDRKIRQAGAAATNAKLKQRRSFAEDCRILLSQIAENGKTRQENMVIAMADRADLGDVKAFLAIRDTVGEKPAESLDLNANIMTEADKALIEKLKARMTTE